MKPDATFRPSSLTSTRSPLILLTFAALLASPPLWCEDSFTINFRALGGGDNPHPPIPQCQVLEMDDPPYPDSTGDCLHGSATSNGQPFECIEAGLDDCPVLTIGVPSPGLFFATTEGLGIVDYDITEPAACPLHCSPDWLIGEDCGDTPGDPCFCDINGCQATPTAHEDWKDALDYRYLDGPSPEEFRIRLGVPTLLSNLSFWRAGFSWLRLERSDCPAPLMINYREAARGVQSADGSFTAPGGGYYLPPNAVITISNPSYLPNSTNDRIAFQELTVTSVNPREQERWRTSCPYLAVPFDRGFTNITTEQWVRTDDDTLPGTDIWTHTNEVPGTSHCGLPNLAGGAEGAACFQSDPGRPGYDTSLISRSIDLSLAVRPILRFVTSFERDDELLEIYSSIDGGSSWTLQHQLDEDQPDGTAIEVPLLGAEGQADVQIRFRYHDPNTTDSATDHAILDDLLIYDDVQLFSDGFESGNFSAWL